MKLTGDLYPNVLQKANLLFSSLPILSSGMSLGRIYEHWIANHIAQDDKAYNISCVKQNGLFVAIVDTNPRLNAVQVSEGSGYAQHTASRNSHALGISCAGMFDATPSDFGTEPIEEAQVELLCAAVAACAKRYSIDIAGVDDRGEPNVLTHGEVAIFDGYFPGDPTVADKPLSGPPYRWDLARLAASPNPLTKDECRATGALLRARARQYKVALDG